MPYTNRLDFPAQLPSTKTYYCFICRSETVAKIKKADRNLYHCSNCGKTNERTLIYDPKMMQLFNTKGELIHYSAGTLLLNEKRELLLFLRTKYPFLYTIPAGHISPNEDSRVAALRETLEEVHINPDGARIIFEGEVRGDSCVGGADIHYWYLYLAQTGSSDVQLDEEGSKFNWFSFDRIPKAITYPVKFFLEQDSILKYIS